MHGMSASMVHGEARKHLDIQRIAEIKCYHAYHLGPTCRVQVKSETVSVGKHKDVNEAWVAWSLTVGAWSTSAVAARTPATVPADLHEVWAERLALMLADGHLLPADAARLVWEDLQGFP